MRSHWAWGPMVHSSVVGLPDLSSMHIRRSPAKHCSSTLSLQSRHCYDWSHRQSHSPACAKPCVQHSATQSLMDVLQFVSPCSRPVSISHKQGGIKCHHTEAGHSNQHMYKRYSPALHSVPCSTLASLPLTQSWPQMPHRHLDLGIKVAIPGHNAMPVMATTCAILVHIQHLIKVTVQLWATIHEVRGCGCNTWPSHIILTYCIAVHGSAATYCTGIEDLVAACSRVEGAC